MTDKCLHYIIQSSKGVDTKYHLKNIVLINERKEIKKNIYVLLGLKRWNMKCFLSKPIKYTTFSYNKILNIVIDES